MVLGVWIECGNQAHIKKIYIYVVGFDFIENVICESLSFIQ